MGNICMVEGWVGLWWKLEWASLSVSVTHYINVML